MVGSPSITTLLSEDGYSHFVVVVGGLVGLLSWWAWLVVEDLKRSRQHRSQRLLGKRKIEKTTSKAQSLPLVTRILWLYATYWRCASQRATSYRCQHIGFVPQVGLARVEPITASHTAVPPGGLWRW